MREIKFRAYDKKIKKWLFGYPKAGGFSLLGEIVILGEIQKIRVKDLNNIEIMQYTGLKDKNGKEIYESDVVSGWVNDYEGLFEVFFDEGAFCLKAIIEDDGYYSCLYEGFPESDLEVIGNIYEEKP